MLTIVNEYTFLLGNPIIWALLATAFICYGLLIELCFISVCDQAWYERTLFWVSSIKQMLAALPLLGLLGTISGLLATFLRISVEKSFSMQEIISGGIAEALFTTLLGLLMVVPGLLMLSYLIRKKQLWMLKQAHEISN